MYKKTLLFSATVLLIVLIFIYSKTTSSPSYKAFLQEENTSVLTSGKYHATMPKERKHIEKNSVSSSKQIYKIPTQDTKDTLKTLRLYKPLSLQEATLNIQARKNIPIVSAIQIDTTVLNQLNIKDTLILPDIEGLDYILQIIQAQTNNDGSVSYTGVYNDEGITYTTTITLSKNESFITLSTANGYYEIETKAGTGYVYKASDIRKHLQKSTASDVIIYPIP